MHFHVCKCAGSLACDRACVHTRVHVFVPDSKGVNRAQKIWSLACVVFTSVDKLNTLHKSAKGIKFQFLPFNALSH